MLRTKWMPFTAHSGGVSKCIFELIPNILMVWEHINYRIGKQNCTKRTIMCWWPGGNLVPCKKGGSTCFCWGFARILMGVADRIWIRVYRVVLQCLPRKNIVYGSLWAVIKILYSLSWLARARLPRRDFWWIIELSVVLRCNRLLSIFFIKMDIDVWGN